MKYRMFAAFGLMAAGIVSGAIVMNAPDTFPFLWEFKAAMVSFVGVGGLLLNFFEPSAPLSKVREDTPSH